MPRRLIPRVSRPAGDFTPDLRALLAADIIIATPEKWDGISRNWQSRGYVRKVCWAGWAAAGDGPWGGGGLGASLAQSWYANNSHHWLGFR